MGRDLRREAKGGGVRLWIFQKQSRTIEGMQEIWVWLCCLECHGQVHCVVNSSCLGSLPWFWAASSWCSEFRTQWSRCFSSQAFVPSSLETTPSLLFGDQVALVVKSLPTSAGDIRDVGLIPGLGRSSGRGHGNPLQYSCLENPMNRGAWWATVHGVAKSQTGLKQTRLSNHSTC